MIIPMIAYCPKNQGQGKDLGWAYNQCMLRLQDEDWAAFIDHDATWTTPFWYRQLEEAIQNLQEEKVACITGVTNRIGCKWQRAPDVDPHNHDMRYHRAAGARLRLEHGAKTEDVTAFSLLSGVVMVVSKAAWLDGCKFQEELFFGVDNSIHLAARKHGWRIKFMPGLYVYHWYRGDGDMSHLPRNQRGKIHMPAKLMP